MPVAEEPGPRRIGPVALALWAACGFLAAVAVSAATELYFAHERNLEAMERFGQQTVDGLAVLAAESMLRRDRIRLGLLATHLIEREKLRSVAIYASDGAPLVVEGSPRTDAPAYTQHAAIEDTAAGRVRITLDAERFRAPAETLLARSAGFLAAGLLLVVGGAYFFAAPRRRDRVANSPSASAADDADQAEGGGEFVVVASVFPRRAAETESGAEAVAGAVSIAERVANLYAGEAVPWREAGVALKFRGTPSEDRAFDVVCAALLLGRLLSEPQDGARTAFRMGLDLAADEAPRVEAVAVMASLAPDWGLVVGRAAYAAVADAERLSLATLDDPAYEALAGDAVPQGVVTGTDAEHEALIAHQADLVRHGSQAVARSSTL